MLAVADLRRRFGGIEAVAGLDLEVRTGEVFGLIGPNGSGKTTLFNLVTGVYPPTDGTIRLDGRDITAFAPHAIFRLGVARTFQNLRIFRRMTVFENVRVAQHAGAADLRQEPARTRRAAVERLLVETGLADRRDELADALPLPDQRRLELARALAARPRLLLLDEPAGGMTPTETAAMSALIRDVARPGRTLMVIEHKMDLIAALCDRVAVLNFGRKISEGAPDRVLEDPAVLEAYLGREEPADA